MPHDQTFLSQQKIRLTDERDRLEAELAQIAEPDPEQADGLRPAFPNLGDDEEENAQEVEQFAERVDTEGTLEEQLAAVRAALGRLADGSYGRCMECHEEIPLARLRVLPSAATCVAHARP